MVLDCPFNTESYASGLMGAPERGARSGLIILRRSIDGTDLHDGVGPWPYLWIGGGEELRAFHEAAPLSKQSKSFWEVLWPRR